MAGRESKIGEISEVESPNTCLQHVVQDLGPVSVNALTRLNIKDFGVCYAGILYHQDFRKKAKMFPSSVASTATTPTPQAYPPSQSSDHVAIGMPVESLRYQPPARPAMARNFELETALPRPGRTASACKAIALGLAVSGASAGLLYRGNTLEDTISPGDETTGEAIQRRLCLPIGTLLGTAAATVWVLLAITGCKALQNWREGNQTEDQ